MLQHLPQYVQELMKPRLRLNARNGGHLEFDRDWWDSMGLILTLLGLDLLPNWKGIPASFRGPYSITAAHCIEEAKKLEEPLDEGNLICPMSDVYLTPENVEI